MDKSLDGLRPAYRKCVMSNQSHSQLTSNFVEDDPTLSTSMFGILMLFRGIGSILSTPISTALQPIQSDPPFTPGQIGIKVAEGRYEKVIIYTGTCFAAAALTVGAGWAVDGRKRSRL